MIREIKGKGELERSAEVIRKSFATVAEDFGLTEQNCPTNPAFIMAEHLEELREKYTKLFGLFSRNGQIGFMAVEREEEAVFCVRRLAVVPEHRHQGHGRKFMEFARDYARTQGGEKVTVRIMDNNIQLKEWYRDLGFAETATKQFEQLPFAVCYMEKGVGG